MVSEDLSVVVRDWQASAARVLKMAAAAAPIDVDYVDSFSLDGDARRLGDDEALAGGTVNEARLDAEIEHLIADSERVIVTSVEEDGGASRAMSALVGTMAISASLLAAAEQPDSAMMSFGLDDNGRASIHGQERLLDELKRTLFGEPPPGVVLPGEVKEQVAKLQKAGTDELVAVTTESVLWEAFSGVASAAQALDKTGTVEELVSAIKVGFNWIKKAGLKLVAWTLDKFQSLVPKKFREQFDEKLHELKASLKEKAVGEVLPNTVGALFGRLGAEDAWHGKESTEAGFEDAFAKLPTVTLQHLDRISQASSFREGALKVAGVLKSAALLPVFAGAAAAGAPYLSAAVVVLAVSVVGFVCYQMWDGFEDIESLAPAVPPS
jgi:hypothetical protein